MCAILTRFGKHDSISFNQRHLRITVCSPAEDFHFHVHRLSLPRAMSRDFRTSPRFSAQTTTGRGGAGKFCCRDPKSSDTFCLQS